MDKTEAEICEIIDSLVAPGLKKEAGIPIAIATGLGSFAGRTVSGLANALGQLVADLGVPALIGILGLPVGAGYVLAHAFSRLTSPSSADWKRLRSKSLVQLLEQKTRELEQLAAQMRGAPD